MKVCIVSDSHDHVALLNYAIETAINDGAEAILHCGDVVAPSTLHPLLKYPVPTHVIHGNNSGDLYNLGVLASKENSVTYHGMDASITLGGRKIFLVHYPHYGEALAATGRWDLVCCGHTHKVKIQTIANVKGGTTTVVNPGTIGGVGTSPATYVLGNLETMTFLVREAPKSIEHQ